MSVSNNELRALELLWCDASLLRSIYEGMSVMNSNVLSQCDEAELRLYLGPTAWDVEQKTNLILFFQISKFPN